MCSLMFNKMRVCLVLHASRKKRFNRKVQRDINLGSRRHASTKRKTQRNLAYVAENSCNLVYLFITTSYINLLGFFVQQQEKENQVGGKTQATTENANNAFRSYADLLMVL